jgi:type II secretory pathway component PulJ
LAKWRIGEAAPYAKEHPSFAASAPRPKFCERRLAAHRARQRAAEGGFTLIELVIVCAVLPMVMGAIAVGILSVFSLQTSVSNRLTDSGDAQLVSLHWQNDVQSASEITTNSSPTNPGPCLRTGSGQAVLMSMQLGNGSEITYGASQSGSDKGYDLWRNVCPTGTTTPSGRTLIAHDIPASVVPGSTTYDPTTPAVKITCSSGTACAVVQPGPPPTFAYANGWVSTLGISGVTFAVKAPDSGFSYSVTALPVATANSSQLVQVSTPSTGCGFAVATSGTYGPTLCFVDFSPWNSQTAATGVTCPSGALPMSANVSNTPFTLDLCMSVTASNCGAQSCTGSTSAPAACGVAPRSGFNDITAVPLPTYTCPGNDGSGSEAFLGNNGFYTGVAGSPALYTVAQGSTAVVNITNIALLNSNGVAATGWQLVTGDAESTDGSAESITWVSDQNLGLLPNSTNSPIGNACGSSGQFAPPNYNTLSGSAGGLSGIGHTTVECTNPVGSAGVNHTGTAMLQAATPTSLKVTLVGSGLQAMFLGVILP